MVVLLFVSLFVLITTTKSDYTMECGHSARIVSPNDDTFSNCTSGRVELFDGTKWGSLAICDKNLSQQHADLICNSLGYDKCDKYYYGSHEYNYTRSMIEPTYISYTKMSLCPSQINETISMCVQCLFGFDDTIKMCSKEAIYSSTEDINIHRLYDIYVDCSYDNNKHNFECSKCIKIDNLLNEANNNEKYKACDKLSEHYPDKGSNNKSLLIAVISSIIVCIFIVAVIIYLYHTKYRKQFKNNKLNKYVQFDLNKNKRVKKKENVQLQEAESTTKKLFNQKQNVDTDQDDIMNDDMES